MTEIKTDGYVAGGSARARILYNLAGVPDTLKLLATIVRERPPEQGFQDVAAKLDNMAAMLTRGLSESPGVRLEADKVPLEKVDIDLDLQLHPIEMAVLGVFAAQPFELLEVEEDLIDGAFAMGHKLSESRAKQIRNKLMGLGLVDPPEKQKRRKGASITPRGYRVYQRRRAT